MEVAVGTDAKILSINFNAPYTSFTIGTEKGFAIYRVNPLEKLCERDLGGGIGIAVQLFETNFLGLVGGGKNPKFPTCKFVLWDDYKAPEGEIVVEEIMKDRIVGVKINHAVVALLTRRRAKLYSLKDMSEIKKIKTINNPNGISALGSGAATVFLCPGLELGTVNIFDYVKGTERTVQCHDHPLRTITLNTSFDRRNDSKGGGAGGAGGSPSEDFEADTLFATTSERGTLIKIFDVCKQVKVLELRRGSDACDIHSVSFSRDSKSLTVTSSKNTVHVYSLSKDYDNIASRASILGGVSSYFSSKWSPFAIDFASTSAVVACATPLGEGVAKTPNTPPPDTYRLLIVGEDNNYAIHDLQFKDTKSIPKGSGLLSALKVPTIKEEQIKE